MVNKRITFSNGFVQDYLHGSIHVVESCLADDIANNAFEFLKRIAQVNELGKDEEHGGILPALYDKIDFSLSCGCFGLPDQPQHGISLQLLFQASKPECLQLADFQAE